MKNTLKITVRLNGTDKNPYHIWGLSQNPFPQIATYEQQGAMLALQKLGGDPIPHDTYKSYIWAALVGHWSDEFIERVVDAFRSGEYRVIDVTLSW